MHVTDQEGLGLFIQALAFAAHKHRQQVRKGEDATPYINHPIALVNVLVNEAGVTDAEVLCAALLHDTIEDTDTTAQELEAAFGARIAALVLEVTDDKRLGTAARKQHQVEQAPHSSPQARLVKLADKICNLRDMLSAPPAGWPVTRKRDYFDWTQQVVAGLRGAHPQLEAQVDALLLRRDELG